MTGGGQVQEQPDKDFFEANKTIITMSSASGNRRQHTGWRHQQQDHNSYETANVVTPTHNTLITLISPRKLPQQSSSSAAKIPDDATRRITFHHDTNNTKHNNENYCDEFHNNSNGNNAKRISTAPNNNFTNTYSDDSEQEEDDDDESLSDDGDETALSAVASAEEYAAKIFKLQQACLTPLKEDLADWLNKIMNLSSITSENFMHKLDNGVIICRLAKIISMWCEQQQFSSTSSNHQDIIDNTTTIQDSTFTLAATQLSTAISSDARHFLANNMTSTTPTQNYPQKLSTSISNVHAQLNKSVNSTTTPTYVQSREAFSNTPTPINRPQPRARVFNASTTATASSHNTNNCNGNTANGQLKATSLSTNCIPTSLTSNLYSLSSSSYLSSSATQNPFLDNLIKMIQTKIWEDAKCRTFYARDNVSNFLRWARGFGVNQSVLFESDDLVLHANTRQVVLCLLDVARIACVRHGFTEAPGLVKFEQEIDRELAAEREASNGDRTTGHGHHSQRIDGAPSNGQQNGNGKKKLSASRDESATNELILRYVKHKEEAAARKKAADEAFQAAAARAASDALNEEEESSHNETAGPTGAMFDPDSLLGSPDDKDSGTSTTKSPTIIGEDSQGDSNSNNNKSYDQYTRVDSLDSGEGRTESASTSHSRTPVNQDSTPLSRSQHSSAIPVPIKQQQQHLRSESNLSPDRESSIATSELSSSRSSLLSNQDSGTASNNNSSNKRHVAASDLDGKVMRIAKSYYGKGARRGVTRLSEGKYKIADRIVFVRLLKGHRVMVRIGGGWDTLENFLFRHKSDPSQVIDVDNLLPLESKMTFQKSSSSLATTPTSSSLHHQRPYSKLPYYSQHQRRSSSASSTNLSTSVDLSVVSPTISTVGGSITTSSSISTSQAICTPVRRTNPPNRQESMPESVPFAARQQQQQAPYLFIHRQNNKYPATPHRANSVNQSAAARSTQLRRPSTGARPLGSSKTPTTSSTTLYPATLITSRISNSNGRLMNGSTNNLLARQQPQMASNSKQGALRRLGRSSDSLQVSYLRTPRSYSSTTTTSSSNNNGSPQQRNGSARRLSATTTTTKSSAAKI